MLVGSFIALQQQNVKRLLAYSGIANAGYMMLAILSVKGDAAPALFYYGAAYILGTLGAFAAALPVFRATGRETVDAFDGLGKKNPWLAGLMTVSLLSIAGIPPMAGFLGKYFLFSEAVENGYVITTVIAILASVVAIYYYFRIILAMYAKPADDIAIRPAFSYWGVLVICVVGGIVLGLVPGAVLDLIR
jgi:NADH-quinone oxidoreductase subunit N